jgi:3-hydroxyisobutyrate dehydrogenase/2-hydroxy-3-oxopropionate reductase
MDRVGLIGLGAMGTPMAWNIHEAGYELGVYNRTEYKTEEFSEAGVECYETPEELTSNSDSVVTMVTGPEALREVVLEDDGVIEGIRETEENTLINTSTVSTEATEEVAEATKEAGGDFIDAPVLGTVGPAERGELLVLAGGRKDVLEDKRPLLEVFGDVRNVGDVGDGTSMKLTANLLLGVMMEGFSEALTFADGQGLPLDDVLEVIQNGVLGAPLYDYKGKVIQERDFSPQFPVNLLFKDLNLVLDASGKEKIPLPAASATREAVSATRSLGYGDEDMMSLIKHLEYITDRKVGEESASAETEDGSGVT